MSERKPIVAVVGAGPAGLYGAQQLVNEGCHVVLLNRDIKPGGLAEYGIFFDKYKMKGGLRKQFQSILASDAIDYYGNLTVGTQGDMTLDELRTWGFDAILVTVGAQGTKWLGLPGEQLTGVYHAKDLVYYYNHLPPFSSQTYPIGRRVAIIGVGNVMLDIAHWAVRYLKVDEVYAIARRDPGAVKFTKKELETVAANLDLTDLAQEMERAAPVMAAVGQDVNTAYQFIRSALPKADPSVSDTIFRLRFLLSPKRILGDDRDQVAALDLEENSLVLQPNGDTKAVGLGVMRTLPVDTVVFAIGDTVDESFGLPVKWSAFVKHPQPRFPVEGVSYEVLDPATGAPLDNIFVAGWSREASSGLVGVARKDGVRGATALVSYLRTQTSCGNLTPVEVAGRLRALKPDLVDKQEWLLLEAHEAHRAAVLGVPEFKFDTNEAMLAAIAQARVPSAGA